MSISHVSQVLSDKWKAMSGEEKSVYYNEAEHLKNLHKIQHPDYKYTPKVSKQESPKPSTIISPASSTPNKQTPEDPNDLEILQVASSSSKASHIQVHFKHAYFL